jgi:23S rRNA (pseudouridine1915-N3)-methyltransferase
VRIVVIAVGRLRERAWRELCDDYLGRIRRSVRCDEIELKTPADIAARIPQGAFVVALEVKGQSLSSDELARRLEQWGRRGKGEIAFLIGGAEGLPPALSAKADVKLSLSSLTLPHRLARVLLCEQIYRGLSILRGEPYARED